MSKFEKAMYLWDAVNPEFPPAVSNRSAESLDRSYAFDYGQRPGAAYPSLGAAWTEQCKRLQQQIAINQCKRELTK